MKAYIKAISYYLPEKVYSNSDFFTEFPELKNNTHLDKIGISQRRIINEGVTAGDLSIQASEKLFSEHGVNRNDIDFVLYCSLEFDYIFPGTSVLIHKQLNFSATCGTLDLV